MRKNLLAILLVGMLTSSASADPMNPDVEWFAQVPGATALSFDSGHTSFSFAGHWSDAERAIRDHFRRLGWELQKDNDTSTDRKAVFMARRDGRQITVAIERQQGQLLVSFDTGGSSPDR